MSPIKEEDFLFKSDIEIVHRPTGANISTYRYPNPADACSTITVSFGPDNSEYDRIDIVRAVASPLARSGRGSYQDGHAAEGHDMRRIGLHPLGWDCPKLFHEVELTSPCLGNLTFALAGHRQQSINRRESGPYKSPHGLRQHRASPRGGRTIVQSSPEDLTIHSCTSLSSSTRFKSKGKTTAS